MSNGRPCTALADQIGYVLQLCSSTILGPENLDLHLLLAELGKNLLDLRRLAADLLRDHEDRLGGLRLQRGRLRRLRGKLQAFQARIPLQHFEDEFLLGVAFGDCHGRPAHLGSLLLSHGKLPHEADVGPHRTHLVLRIGSRLRQIRQHRRRVQRHPLA